MDDIHFDAIDSVSVIPFFDWFTDRTFSEVLAREYFGTDMVPNAAPHSNLHLVMCVVRSRIKYEDRIVSVGGANITLPKVSVD